jgi:hypothetical protein
MSDRKIKFQKSVKNSTLFWLPCKSAESGSIYLPLVWCILFGEQRCVFPSNCADAQPYFPTYFLGLRASQQWRVPTATIFVQSILKLFSVNKRPIMIILTKFQNFRFFYIVRLRLIFTRNNLWMLKHSIIIPSWQLFMFHFPCNSQVCRHFSLLQFKKSIIKKS